MRCPRPAPGLLLAVLLASSGPSFGQTSPSCTAMALPVDRVDAAPSQYLDFCGRNPEACRLDGPSVLSWTEALHALLREVNAGVNAEVAFVADMDNLGLEEHWDFPRDCRGDCEDFVLEKRERLVGRDLPRAALTIAFAFHTEQFFPHAVLLAETTRGTLVLDNLHDEVLCWDALPYRYTRRERPDGHWDRFSPR